ncbi:hypothetical protein [Nonomuraea sp. NEAU-A123]|uniref:hypothetical protein n=1 Tax=Nonomuraea sp. NEAU-A123 TaxID=2839649 RepID=UPI001BE449FF|nr:hypothetical protein [Nonomuraea sp. NEAU-A123]MBT2232536.1 hypothetical protein [Nonomuraea sp. NEAU-A123]
MLDDELAVVPEADAFLRHVRFGRDQAELTTHAYAGHIAFYLRWCVRTGRDWRTAAADLALFVTWLRYGSKETTGIEPSSSGLVLAVPGAGHARGAARIENVLTDVRQFLCHGITVKTVPGEVLAPGLLRSRLNDAIETLVDDVRQWNIQSRTEEAERKLLHSLQAAVKKRRRV